MVILHVEQLQLNLIHYVFITLHCTSQNTITNGLRNKSTIDIDKYTDQ